MRADDYALAGYVDVFDHLRVQVGDPRIRQSVRRGNPTADSLAHAAKALGDCLDGLRELGGAAEGTSTTIAVDGDEASRQREALSSIADLCFIAQRELRPFVARLTRADEAGATVETVYRKLRRICARVLVLLCPLVGRTIDVTDEQQEIVEVSIAVRRVYTRFRRSLVTTLTDDDGSVTQALKAAASSITQLLGHVDRTDIRVQDVALMQGLERRIATWFREQGSMDAGRRIHADLVTTSDLLRLVNQRQELRAHDAEVIETALSLAGAGPGSYETLLMMLGPLEGMDDTLDALRASASRAPSDATMSAVEARLAELRAGRQESQAI